MTPEKINKILELVDKYNFSEKVLHILTKTKDIEISLIYKGQEILKFKEIDNPELSNEISALIQGIVNSVTEDLVEAEKELEELWKRNY